MLDRKILTLESNVPKYFLTLIGMDSLASSINKLVSNSLDFSCLGFYVFM